MQGAEPQRAGGREVASKSKSKSNTVKGQSISEAKDTVPCADRLSWVRTENYQV